MRVARSAPSDQPALAILEKAGSYFLGMAPDGSLEGAIGEYRKRTAPGVVLPARWEHVALRFDAGGLELSVDGVPREAEAVGRDGGALREAKPTVPLVAPVTASGVTISSPTRSFPGAIDEVKLSGGVEPLVFRYADSEQILGWKKVIHFDGRGRLDPKFHPEPVRMVLVEIEESETSGGSKTAVLVDYSLTFAEWLAKWDDPPPMRQSEEEAKLETAHASARKVAIEVDRLGVVR